jgi:transcriptional regulator with XRE-family HTH domain
VARSGLPYPVRARIADNVFVLRRRAGISQETLAGIALVSTARIGRVEGGRVGGRLDSYVRLAGALDATLDDLLAGVIWSPPIIESEVEGGYTATFDSEAPAGSGALVSRPASSEPNSD